MTTIIVDNVNNMSGAPAVAREIAAAIHAPIYCLREERVASYRAAGVGVRSEARAGYLIGLLALLTDLRFLRNMRRSDVVICNTALTFPLAVLARVFRKRAICALHETTPKNLLYSAAMFCAIRAANLIVTPSHQAYADTPIPPRKWRVIMNTLPEIYSEEGPSIPTDSPETYVLFVDANRAYKGREMFRQVKELATARGLGNIRFHSTNSEEFLAYAGPSPALGPEIYQKYHFVLVLTDNSRWRETFGLVGCEAAACRCVPLFTDAFAYCELWAKFEGELHIRRYEPSEVIERLLRLLASRERLQILRNEVRGHALAICDRSRFRREWGAVLEEVRR